ncbi:hypothetical protein PINS_up020355 [Pythium insidiosum]|nr:hypothetical protein PINS_up020355 [Pythium insidiosum]
MTMMRRSKQRACFGVVSTDWIRDACFELMAKDVVSMDLSRSLETREFQWKICVDWKAYMASTGPHDGLAFPSLRDGKPHRAMRDFMAWLLWRSRATTQWRYAFEDELDALYRRVVVREWPSRPCGFEIHDVYAQIDVKAQLARDTSNVPAEIVVSGPLLATLRPYQRAAVSWMLAREKGTPRCVKSAVPTRCVQFLTPENLFFDPFCARFYQTTEDPSLALGSSDLNNLNGGILADEMGLGKTVEVISLVLSHRAPSTELRIVRDAGALSSNSGMHEDEVASTDIVSPDSVACICRSAAHVESGWIQCERCFTWHHRVCTGLTESEDDADAAATAAFICFQCHAAHGIVWDCKTTLIVSPASIHDQWESELTRHVTPGTLKLLRYPGVKELRSRLDARGPSAEWTLLARPSAEMARYDVVLTTYEALASDLYHIPTESGQERRASMRQRRKRYAFITSPLVHLRFWRICMDEAQVGVENTRLQAALTVARLASRFRWGRHRDAAVHERSRSLRLLFVSPCGSVLQRRRRRVFW